jgi:hypothetical protein
MIHNEVIYEKARQEKVPPGVQTQACGLVVDQGYSKAEAGRSLGVKLNLTQKEAVDFRVMAS